MVGAKRQADTLNYVLGQISKGTAIKKNFFFFFFNDERNDVRSEKSKILNEIEGENYKEIS